MTDDEQDDDSVDIGEVGDQAAIRRKIREVRADRAAAREGEKPGWTAVNQLHRLEVSLLEQLHELRRLEAEAAAAAEVALSPAELLKLLLACVADLSDDDLRAIDVAVGRRLGRA